MSIQVFIFPWAKISLQKGKVNKDLRNCGRIIGVLNCSKRFQKDISVLKLNVIVFINVY